MLNAALAQGKPTMVIAMTTAAITQASAIHRPPKTIQSRLRRRETIDIAIRRPTTRLTAGARAPATPVIAARFAGSRATAHRRHRRPLAPRRTVESYVAEHARDDVARRAELVGLVHDEQRQRCGDDVKSPIRASRPKRTPVPGMTSAVSSKVASASIRAMRAPLERGRPKSKPKP
jgi:hypothetical protein